MARRHHLITFVPILALVAALVVVSEPATAAAAPRTCSSAELNLTLPVGEGYEVEHVVYADCTISSSATRHITAAKAQADAGASRGDYRQKRWTWLVESR